MAWLDPIRPYLGIAKVVALGLLVAGAYLRGRSNGVEGERTKWEVKVSEARQQRLDEYETKLASARANNAATATEAATAQAKVETSEKAYTALLNRIPTKPLVIHEEPKPGDVCPPAPRLSPDFRLRFNEAVLGTGPADH